MIVSLDLSGFGRHADAADSVSEETHFLLSSGVGTSHTKYSQSEWPSLDQLSVC